MEKNSVQFMILKEFYWNSSGIFFTINNSISFQWNLIFSSGIRVEFLCPLDSSGIPLSIFYGVRRHFLHICKRVMIDFRIWFSFNILTNFVYSLSLTRHQNCYAPSIFQTELCPCIPLPSGSSMAGLLWQGYSPIL